MYQLTAACTKNGGKISWDLKELVGEKATEIWKSDTAQLEDVAREISTRSVSQTAKTERATVNVTAEIQARKGEHEDHHLKTLREDADDEHELQFLGPDGDAVEFLLTQLQDARSGAHSYSVFHKFLDYECARFQTFNIPMSLVVFEFVGRDGTPLPAIAATTIVLRLSLIKHKLDVIGVFEDKHIALLLPNTRPEAATFVANKAIEIIYSSPLAPGVNKGTLKVTYKIAGFPDDGDDLRSLLSKIKKTAKPEKSPSADDF
jgi:hypothetical protein